MQQRFQRGYWSWEGNQITVVGPPAVFGGGYQFMPAVFQGAFQYDRSDLEAICVVISGRVFLIRFDQGFQEGATSYDAQVTEVQLPRLLYPLSPRVWFAQVNNFLVIQDGISQPIILDSLYARTAIPNQEVPIGTIMTYGAGRLWVVSPDFRSFEASNIDLQNDPTQALQFTEDQYFGDGGAFVLPGNFGNITGMSFSAIKDPGSAFGDLIVIAERGAATVNTLIPRADWVTTNIVQIVLNSYGSVADNSLVNVNADLLYRRSDGIGSYSAGRSQEYAYVRRPISKEIKPLLDLDSPYMLNAVSAAFYENRALFTIWPRLGTFNISDSSGNPIATSQQIYFDAIAALDFYAQASVGEGQLPGAYDGEWDKWQFLQVFTSHISGQTRCFAMVKLPNPFPLDSRLGTTVYSDSILGMCEIREDALDDGNGDRISCSIETRLMTFSDSFQFKNLLTGDLYIRDMIGKVDSTLYWKPDDYACYVFWGSWTGCADQFNCDYDPTQCFVPGAKWPGYLPRLRAPTPPQTANPCTSLFLRRGFGFQFRLDWLGHMKIYQLGFTAAAELEYTYAPAQFFKTV